jgi:hypothetical protein
LFIFELNNSFALEHEDRFYNDVVLEQFHRDLANQLEGDNGDAVAQQIIKDLNDLRSEILRTPMNAHLIFNSTLIDSNVPIPDDAWDFLDVSKQGLTPAEKITVNFIQNLSQIGFRLISIRTFPLSERGRVQPAF